MDVGGLVAAGNVLVRGDDLYIKRDDKALQTYKLGRRNGKPVQYVQFLLGFFQNGCTNFAGLFDLNITSAPNSCPAMLTPKHSWQLLPLRSVENVITLPSMDVRSMRIGLILNGYITYEFGRPSRNQPLDPSIFEAPENCRAGAPPAIGLDGGKRGVCPAKQNPP
jgi:hypothetical protein